VDAAMAAPPIKRIIKRKSTAGRGLSVEIILYQKADFPGGLSHLGIRGWRIANLAKISWLFVIFDTAGEFIFVGCQPTNKPGFQAPAEHELC
jgi:hypothetical protein